MYVLPYVYVCISKTDVVSRTGRPIRDLGRLPSGLETLDKADFAEMVVVFVVIVH